MSAASPAKPKRIHSRWLLASCLIAGLAVLGFLGWFWRQSDRPGARLEAQGLEDARRGQYREALQEWQNGVKEDPTYPGCHERLGDVARELGHLDQAEAAYQAAARLDSKDVPLLLKLVDVAQKRGDTQVAGDAAHRATELAPDDAEAASLYGTLEARQRHYPTALEALRRAHALKPDTPRYLVKLAVAEMDVEDMRSAEQVLAPYVQAHPEDAHACYFMAIILNQKPHTPQNVGQTLRYASLALAGMRDDVRIYNLLGQLYLELGQPAEALHAYQLGLHLDPNDEGILHGLVQGFTQTHDTVAVQFMADQLQIVQARHDRMSHFQKVLQLDPADTTAALEMGHLEEAEGKPNLAQDYYVSAVSQAPNDPRTRPALATFMRRMGRPDLARQALRPDFVPPPPNPPK